MAVFVLTALSLIAAGRAFAPYASVKPILDAQRERLPAELRSADESKWLAWTQRRDKAIRARLEQGDLDSFTERMRCDMFGDASPLGGFPAALPK